MSTLRSSEDDGISGTQSIDEAYFVEDEVSFTAPRLRAIEDCISDFKNAGKTVKGSEARIAAVLADYNALEKFRVEVAQLIESKTFDLLPEFQDGSERIDGYHYLTVFPWRGVFLVSSDGDHVAAIIFSRHPHRLEDRFPELHEPYKIARNPAIKDDKGRG